MRKGVIVKSTGSWYVIKDEEENFLNARIRGKFRLEDRKVTNPVAVGDKVLIKQEADNTWVIYELLPRRNYIIRKSPKKTGHSHILSANIDQAVLVASFKKPKTSWGFIDRFLVTAEAYSIPSVLIFNKSDLINTSIINKLQCFFDYYESIGYPTLLTSFRNSIDESIIKIFNKKVSLIGGHSGVGKSTLINKLIPKANQVVNEVSGYADKGIHTTTFAEMFQLNNDSFLIDTPGIKELGIIDIESHELNHFFPEMRQLFNQCKYYNCTHIHEPGCAVIEAVKNGKILEDRYKSYLSIVEDHDNRR